MEWYSNPWVIGIVGSIPGGFLVNWVTGKILGRRENREYLQKVLGANREVVYAIRPGISEGQIPTAEVLTALLNATARRYGVEAADLYSAAQIAEELVKEVMDSSFISSGQKGEYCAKLATLGNTAKPEIVETAKEGAAPTAIAVYRQRLISSMSMLLGILTTTMTVMYSLMELIRSKKLESRLLTDDITKRWDLFIPVLATIVTLSVTVLIYIAYRDLLRRRRGPVEVVRSFSDIQIELKRNRPNKDKPPD
jgi:hypothetical protein